MLLKFALFMVLSLFLISFKLIKVIIVNLQQQVIVAKIHISGLAIRFHKPCSEQII